VRHRKPLSAIPDFSLCSGPGNVTHAMGITLKDTGRDLLGDKLSIEDRGHRFGAISWSQRVGISVGAEHHWRCYASQHEAVSGRRM